MNYYFLVFVLILLISCTKEEINYKFILEKNTDFNLDNYDYISFYNEGIFGKEFTTKGINWEKEEIIEKKGDYELIGRLNREQASVSFYSIDTDHEISASRIITKFIESQFPRYILLNERNLSSVLGPTKDIQIKYKGEVIRIFGFKAKNLNEEKTFIIVGRAKEKEYDQNAQDIYITMIAFSI